MKNFTIPWTRVRIALAVALGAGLASCGGGGGGGDDGPQYVPVTAASRDTVAHAGAGSVLAMATTGAIQFSADSSAATRLGYAPVYRPGGPAAAGTWLPPRVVDVLLRGASGQLGATRSGLARPLAAYPDSGLCMISGSWSNTWDDRDNNGLPSIGDTLSMVFTNCSDYASETLNGKADATFTQIAIDGSGNLSAMGAQMRLTQLSNATTNHSMALDGNVAFNWARMSAVSETTTTTAQGPVVAVVKTHEFSDTVTLRAGFVEQSTYDSSVPPPTGASTWGSATVTVNGTIESVQAGGLLDIATLPTAPLVTYSDDMYPSAGTVQVRGSTGSLQIRAVSPTSAALALDANDDAVPESTSTVTWDWLL